MDIVRIEQLRTVVRNLVRPGHMDTRQGRAFYDLFDEWYAMKAKLEATSGKIQSSNTQTVEKSNAKPKKRRKNRNSD